MLLGLVRPSAGQVELFGTQVRPGQRSMWPRAGYLVESSTAYPELTMRENLRAAARLRGLSDRRVVDEAIGRLGLVPIRPAGAHPVVG